MQPDETNPYATPKSNLASSSGPPERYDSVPWYRKSGINSLFLLLGLCCSPFIIWVCVVVLTGDIYYNKVDDQGQLKRWSRANKVAAVIIMLIQVSATIFQISRGFLHNQP